MLTTRTTTITIEAAGLAGSPSPYGDPVTTFTEQNTNVGASFIETRRRDDDPHQSSELVERRYIVTIGSQYVVAEGDRILDEGDSDQPYRVDEVRQPRLLGGVNDQRLTVVRLD